ncbi:unnamed protein product, partial [Onchocerca ochengi]
KLLPLKLKNPGLKGAEFGIGSSDKLDVKEHKFEVEGQWSDFSIMTNKWLAIGRKNLIMLLIPH